MKKYILITLLITILFTNVNCGGGVESSDSSGKTTVKINIGKITASEKRLALTTSAIPTHIATVRFTITAPDIVTIVREVSVAGKESVSETFEILNGTNRNFLIEALDVSGRVIYKKTTFVDLAGSDVHLIIEMEPTDVIPPDFTGLSDINSITETSLTLNWQQGDDNVTTTDKIQYLIYRSDTPGGEDFASPGYTTTGATSYNVTGLSPATTYYFVVRAKDETGNKDSNSIEISATTLSPPDTTAPDFGGLSSAVTISTTSLRLSWNSAADDTTASSNIVYNIYRSISPGGETYTSPSYTTGPGVTSYTVTGLSPGTTYYFVVRAKDEAGNTDDNTIEKSATTQLSGIDLTVDTITTNPCSPVAVCPQIDITVYNVGNIDASSVQVYYIHETCSRTACFYSCDFFSIPQIAAQSSVLLSDLVAPDTTNYLVIADPENLIKEIHESNNEKCSGATCTDPPAFDICY